MEENEIIKFDAGALQKVGNAIDITNKLLQNNFDYLKWWSDLDENWKESFNTRITLESAILKFKGAVEKKENAQNELGVIKYCEEYKENKCRSVDSIKYLFSLKKIEIWKKENSDLEPIKLLAEIEELIFRNQVEVKNLAALKYFKRLKKVDFTKAIINKEEIENFKKDYPDCEVIV